MLVILVPKKDGTWHMCINCRAINNITIKYKHHILMLDDMLDELYGACVFSKINKNLVIIKFGLEKGMSAKRLSKLNLVFMDG